MKTTRNHEKESRWRCLTAACVGLELSSNCCFTVKCSLPVKINSSCFPLIFFSLGYITFNFACVVPISSLIPILYICKLEKDFFVLVCLTFFKKITFHWMHAEPGLSPLVSYIWAFSEKQEVPLMSLRWTKPPSVFCVFAGLVCSRISVELRAFRLSLKGTVNTDCGNLCNMFTCSCFVSLCVVVFCQWNSLPVAIKPPLTGWDNYRQRVLGDSWSQCGVLIIFSCVMKRSPVMEDV